VSATNRSRLARFVGPPRDHEDAGDDEHVEEDEVIETWFGIGFFD